MKAFRFNLEAVLTLRERAEQAAQVQCALAYADERRAAEALRRAEAALAEAGTEHTALLSNGCPAVQIEQLRKYSVVLEARRIELARLRQEAQQKVAEARSRLILATQGREALEHLRTRQRTAHAYHAAHLEQLALDEMAGRGGLVENMARTIQ